MGAPSMILWLQWRWFYLRDAIEGPPVVVLRDKRALDANRAATERGVYVGMEMRQIANVAPGCQFRQWNAEAFVERQRAWLDVCSEFSGIVEPIDQHVVAVDLSGHPNRIDMAERLVKALGDHMHLPLRYGAAPAKWIAALAAEKQELGLAVSDPGGFLARLPVECLLPASPEARERLSFLGYRWIGDVTRIPMSTLRGQFGEEALTILQAAQGRGDDPVRALYPRGVLKECLLFDSPVEDWETLRESRNRLAARLADRLDGRQSSLAELSVELEDGTFETFGRTFTKAIYHALTASAALRLLLPDQPQEMPADSRLYLNPAESEGKAPPGVVALRVTLKDLEPVRQRQHRLIETHLRPNAEAAIRAIQTTFGERAVRLGTEVVPPRRERVLREWRHATGWY